MLYNGFCSVQLDTSFNELFPLHIARTLFGCLTMTIAHIHSPGFVRGGL